MYLYHIQFSSADEIFDKIGITKHTPFKRFGKDHYKEYSLKVLNIKKLPDKECKLLEKELHKKYLEFKYVPLNDEFSGKTECFYIDSVSI